MNTKMLYQIFPFPNMTVENKPLEVLVVGAGVAGLSAAIALGKQGHRVTVRSATVSEFCLILIK
jgi:NADPH-dependent 2,4-dienoyl-CoA reductase/sulfur reductase-like enzyme